MAETFNPQQSISAFIVFNELLLTIETGSNYIPAEYFQSIIYIGNI